jgi:hypothetical protein
MLFERSRKSRAVAVAAAAMLAGSLACIGIAQAAPEGEGELAPGAVAAPIIGTCRGGVQEAVQVVTNSAPTSRGEGVMANLAGASINYAVPAGDTDLLVVTFSSETNLSGAGAGDKVEVRATLDNVPMDPVGPNTFIETTNDPIQNSATWCVRAGAGAHTVRIQWSVTDVGAANVVNAQVDDTAFHLEVSN